MDDCRLNEILRHRRSISQLIAAGVDEVIINFEKGYVNPAMDNDDDLGVKPSTGDFIAAAATTTTTTTINGKKLPSSQMKRNYCDGDGGDGVSRMTALKLSNDNEDSFDDDYEMMIDGGGDEGTEGNMKKLHENNNNNNDNSESACQPDLHFSIVDSEYDETLAFPDSVTILSNVGDKPVLVERKDTTTTDEDDDDNYADNNGNNETIDGGCGVGGGGGGSSSSSSRTTTEIPLTTLYAPSIKFKSFQRKVFIPDNEIQVNIIDTERSVTTHFLNPNLYTIELSHGPFTWQIKKRYKHFNSLHQQLSFFRTSLNIPFPMRSHKEKRATIKSVADEMVNEEKPSSPSASPSLASPQSRPSLADGRTLTKSIESDEASIRRKKKKKRKLPRFPNRPESLVTVESLPTRIRQLEEYLYNLLNISLYRSHHETLNFVEVSNVSFISELGMKGKEGPILKRTGSLRPGQAGCDCFGCFQRKCCIRLNYFCTDVLWGKWRNRWFFVKETCFGYLRPTDGAIRSVILFDQGFDVSTGIYQTGMRKGLQVITNNRHIILKCWTRRKAKEWLVFLKQTANTYARDFTYPNPHASYAPVRTGSSASWFVDGSSYMGAIADALESATTEIYIADWWLSPEIYMKRPAINGDYWRLDRILHRKASEGVRIFVLLYKEVEMALGINSFYSKQTLVNTHENIKIMRHPDHARAGIFFWAHHEKIVVIDQTYAFIGGIDLCYGRWDDHRHRLTDLGSISTASVSDGSTRKVGGGGGGGGGGYLNDNDSAFGSRKSSRNNANAMEEEEEQEKLATPQKPPTVILQVNDEIVQHSTAIDGSEIPSQFDRIKLNTPEMERRNVLEILTQNAMKKGKDLVSLVLTMSDNTERDNLAATTIDSKQLTFTNQELEISRREVERHLTPPPPSSPPPPPPQIPDTDFYGQAKFWFGKDYSNLIMKDFVNLDAPYVDIIDRATMPRMPWHDVGIAVVGASARDVARHFIQRWNAIKLEKMRDNQLFPYLLPKSYTNIKIDSNRIKWEQTRCTCQLLRSISSWSCGFIESDLVEQSIHDAYIQTIMKSEHYIYIENQFFITMQVGATGEYGNVRNQIGETLFKRISRAHKQKKTFRVYVVMPLLPGFEGDVGGTTGNAVRAITHWNYASISRGRSAILTRLKEIGISNPSEYISFHSLRTYSELNSQPITELIYVHSKLLICDDRIVICGSANINDRSMIGKRDSEIAAIVHDEEFEVGRMNGQKYSSGIFAGRLRKYLFKEHLGLLEPDADCRGIDVVDPVIDSFWNGIWKRVSSRNTQIYDDVFKCVPNNHGRSFANLRKYQEEPAMSKIDPEKAFKLVKQIQGFLVDLPLDFLNQEVLTPPGTSKEGLIPTSVWT